MCHQPQFELVLERFQSELENLIHIDEVVKFRVYGLISDISSISAAHHSLLEKRGLLNFMIDMDTSDILSSLNSIEFYILV
jgi:hypothetical protein